jgi:phosphopantetheinyl transferase
MIESDCAIALLDGRQHLNEDWTSVLSARERAEVATYSHPERRARTIASRVLAKYLLTCPQPLRFQRPHTAAFRAAMNSEWASVELLSGTARTRVRPTIFRAGNTLAELSVSAAHSGPFTATCISRGRVGLDLERIEPRRAEFYERSFSAEEQGWVCRINNRTDVSKETGFTLLWSIKEAFLKASGKRDISIWTFPRWTVRFADTIQGVRRLFEGVSISADILSRDFSQTFEVATMQVDGMILTTVRY